MATLTFNNWGVLTSDVLSLLPHTDVCSFGGANAVAGIIEMAAREVARSLRDDIIEQMTHVKYEMIVEYATEGQTSATTLLSPIIDGTIHLWRYSNPGGCSNNDNDDILRGGCRSDLFPPKVGACEVDTDDYSVTLSTGAVTFSSDLLKEDDRVFISYHVDTEDENFSVATCADATKIIAASDVAAQLMSNELAEYWRLRAKVIREQLLKGDFIPAELRSARYWREVTRSQSVVHTREMRRSG